MSGCSRPDLPIIEASGHYPTHTGYMSGQCFKVLKVSERFYEGLFFYRHPKVLLKRQPSVSTGHLETVVPVTWQLIVMRLRLDHSLEVKASAISYTKENFNQTA